jgi:hypothetical protein
MLSLATAFIINNIWTLLLGVAFIFNAIQRKDIKPIYYTSLILVMGFAIPAMIYAQKIVNISPLLSVYYLYWAAVNACIVLAIVLTIKLNRWPMYTIIKLLLVCLSIDVAFNLLLHIDRNIMALNGNAVPNMGKENVWELWVLRNTFSSVSNFIMLIGVTLPLTSRLKGAKDVFKQLLNVIDIRQYRAENRTELRIEIIESIIKQSANQNDSKQYLDAAKELMYRADETQTNFNKPIELLLDAAAHSAYKAPVGTPQKATS